MTKIFGIIGFMTMMLMVFHAETSAQYIIAGQHTPSGYFVDIDPDTTLTGPYSHPPGMFPAATFPIDINGDLIEDFILLANGGWMNGGGDKFINIHSCRKGTAQVAFGRLDTCWYMPGAYMLTNLAKSFRQGDTIDKSLVWYSDSILCLYSYNWFTLMGGCQFWSFENNPEGNYIGVRLLSATDTVYGWIKVTDVYDLSFTLQEFAFGVNATGIPARESQVNIYPNPAKDIIIIETRFKDGYLEVYNTTGKGMLRPAHFQGSATVDMTGMPSGVYMLKLISGKTVITRKLVKW